MSEGNETIHLAIPVDGAYRRWGEVTAASARAGASRPVDVHWIDWSVCDRAKLEAMGTWHGSAIAWSRLFLAEILPRDVDWVISCDADVLFRGDIAKLWALRDERYVVMMSRDSMPPWFKENPKIGAYCREHGLDAGEILCSGITLVNLRRWRAEGWQAKMDAFLAHHASAAFLDQIALNVVLREVKCALPRAWGCFSGDLNADVDYAGDCAIHYVSDAPWKRGKVTQLMSDVVVLWRRAAGMRCGGWRRWVWLGLRATHGWWKGSRWMAWHFRNAAPRRRAVLVMHPAPYRDSVCRVLAREGVEVAALFGRDPNHPWAFGGEGKPCSLWRYALGSDYRMVVWTAYWPLKFLLPILVRWALGRAYALAVDTTSENGGWFARVCKGFVFGRARFLWVPGKASRRFLAERYGMDEARFVEGLYRIDPGEVAQGDAGRELPRRAEELRFLMVANEFYNRSIGTLVEGFRAYGKGSLVLCGKGLAGYAGGNVKVVDGVTWTELPRLYAEADVYVHNGCEQYSTAVQIAALRGMPIICSRDVGIAADIEVSVGVRDWRSAEAWAEAFRAFERRLPEVPRTRFEGTIEEAAQAVLRRL